MIKSLSGWLIHKQSSGESSVQLFVFTQELGLIPCLYRGGRSAKKQMFLQPFTPLWISLIERHERFYVQALESMAPSLKLSGAALFSSLYLNELLYYALPHLNPDAALFNAYLMTLKGLALEPDKLALESLLRQFEWVLLKACGYCFSLTEEARTAALIRPDFYYQFIPSEGLVAAAEGISGKHILAFALGQLEKEGVLQAAKLILRAAIDHLLGGKTLKTRALFIQFAK